MTQAELQNRIIARASQDGEFRAQLRADPREAVHQLTGMVMPDAQEVLVHQETATSFHPVLHPDSRLTEPEMEMVFDGVDWACSSGACGVDHP